MRKSTYIGSIMLFFLALIIGPANGGDVVLSVNSGADNTVWFVSGEPSLVMNGFDLGPLNMQLPATIDRVSIDVNTPVPGASIDLLIYEDGNGGSPIDARLVSQTQVNIQQAGTFTHVFSTPVTISQPVVWVGFYLPVDFRYLADTSGSSVLTYWAWTPGGRFDVNNLSSAQIFGPADGSAPVNIDLNGKARITAEITGANGSTVGGIAPTTLGDGPIVQLFGGATVDLSIMQPFLMNECDTLYRDSEDIAVTYRSGISVLCKRLWPGYSPPDPAGYFRRQILYEITFFQADGLVLSDWLPVKVTHCISPHPDDLDKAVVGQASGVPRIWEIRPTLRYGNLVCAEIGRSGLLSYFIPSDETLAQAISS